MAPQFTLKNTDQEMRLVRGRIDMAGALVFFLAVILLLRVFYLQVVQHEHFTTLSQHNRVRIEPIAPIRGLIFSSDGVLLADNRPSFSLEVIPELIDDIDETVRALTGFVRIEEQDIRRFKEQLKRKRRFENIPLRLNLSDEEVARVAVNRHLFPGVDVVAGLNRYYPLGMDLAHTIGYVGRINEEELTTLDTSNYSATTHIGKLGVEKAYEGLLHGQVGYRQVEVNAQGRVIRVLERTPPKPGSNIYLTLDVSLQNLAVQALAGKRGAIVAIQPDSGGVLAMVSSPSYDPNPFVNGIDAYSYRQLLASKNAPLLNRALQGKYPPGSTIKPFLGLAALEYGIRESGEVSWCPGWYMLKGSTHRYRDWKKEGHGESNLISAIAQSCDVYFYKLAHDLGIERIYAGLLRFGFGEKTGIDIGSETSGLIPSREWKRKAYGQAWFPGETLISGIGQGASLITPVQLATATAAIATRGRLMRPHLLSEVRDSSSEQIIAEDQGLVSRSVNLVQSKHWDEIIHSMTEVVHGLHGTARGVGLNASYQFAGKTGTAQVVAIAQGEEYEEEAVAEEHRDHALFIAFAPVEAPIIALAIIVENAGSGSSSAAPIARELFDHYLQDSLALTVESDSG